MNQPPPHRPARWEDLAGCLVWPILLKLPALALRPSRLGIAYLAAIPLTLLWKTNTPLLNYLAFLFQIPQQIITSITLPWFMERSLTESPQPDLWFSLYRFANIPAEADSWLHYLIAAAAILLITITATMLARSTALEVARGLQVSPRYMLGWLARRWKTPFLTLWPIPLAILIAIPPLLLARAAALFTPETLPATILLALAAILALLASIVVYFALAAAPLAPAATACDDGDDFDALQRTIAIVIALPLRTILCFAWILLIMNIAAAITRWLVDATVQLLPLAGESLAPSIPDATIPLQILPTAVALSTFATGLTLTYLYLRRIADEQDATEVPINA